MLWLLLLAEVLTGGNPAPAPDASHQPAVHVFVVGSSVEPVRAVVDAFSRRDAQLRLTQVATIAPADVLARGDEREISARVWIDVSTPGRARITIADGLAERFLVRELALSNGLDEIGKETLAQVVESSVAALLENQQLGLTRAQASSVLAGRDGPPPPPVPSPPPSPPPVPRWARTLSAAYQVQAFSPQIPLAQGPSLRAAVGSERGSSVWLEAGWVLPQSVTTSAVGVDLQTMTLRLGAGLGWPVGPRVRIAAAAAIGADLVRVAPRQGELGGATLQAARWTTVTVVRAEASVWWSLGRRLEVGVVPSLELDPVRRHYDLTGSDTTAEVVAPHAVRPGLALALGWR